MKKMIEDAQRVAKGALQPTYTKNEYEDAMLKIAEDEAGGNESPALAFSRLISGREPRMLALYKAARRASAKTTEQTPSEEIAKAASAKDRIFGLMWKVVRIEKQPDENEAHAFNRLVREDKDMSGAYALYRSLA